MQRYLKMENIMESNSNATNPPQNIDLIGNQWPSQNQEIAQEAINSSTLLYIAVEYVKDDLKESNTSDTPLVKDFSNLHPQVDSLNQNLNTEEKFNSIYNEQTSAFNSVASPVVIHQLVSPQNDSNGTWVANLDNASLENLRALLCSSDAGENQYLQMTDDCIRNVDNKCLRNDQEVEIVITDQTTGISYAVSTHELLVENGLEDQQLLESLSPDLDSELLTIDEKTLKNNLPAQLISSDVTSTVEANVNNLLGDLTHDIKEEMISENELSLAGRRRKPPNEEESEEQLFSKVYAISDKPVLSRARASLPETYLCINKIEESSDYGVFAKKCIRKRTQFGPMHGFLRDAETFEEKQDLCLRLFDHNKKLYVLDISNENNSNWMRFVRKATTYEELNLVISQHDESLYFTVVKNIFPKQELKVGYSIQYANLHNLPILENIPEKAWTCFECSETFATSHDLQNHLDTHEDVKVNENIKPKKKMWKKRRRPQLKMTAIEALQCRLCQQVFNPPKFTMLKNHLAIKHDMVEVIVNDYFVIIKNFKCEKCNLVFNMESLLKIHNLLHNPDDNSEDETFHICPACHKKFTTQKQLIHHISMHSLPKYKIIPEKFQCPICYSFYSMRERLQRHMLVHGPDDTKPFPCKICHKRFMNSSALTCHIKIHLAGENVYECPICKETFDHMLKLKLHVTIHCVNNTYTCPHCSKTFRAYSVIRKHIRSFHSDKRFECLDCGKTFHTDDKLKQHSLKHSDHREFLCSDCGKQFKRKDKLNEHFKRFHIEKDGNRSVKKSLSENKQAKAKNTLTHFDRFIYKCHSCVIGFKRRGMLVNHLAKRHPDVSPDSVPELNLPILRTTRDYYCPYCDKVYKSSSKRKAHIQKNHPGAPLLTGLPNPTFSQTVGSVTTVPQNCQWCHKQYASKAKLMQHLRKEHPESVETGSEKRRGKIRENDEDGKEEHLEGSKEKRKNDFVSNKVVESVLSNQLEEFIDDPLNDSLNDPLDDPSGEYCHLVNVGENPTFSETTLGTPTQLYRLLTNTNDMVPNR